VSSTTTSTRTNKEIFIELEGIVGGNNYVSFYFSECVLKSNEFARILTRYFNKVVPLERVIEEFYFQCKDTVSRREHSFILRNTEKELQEAVKRDIDNGNTFLRLGLIENIKERK